MELKELLKSHSKICNEIVKKFAEKQDLCFDGWFNDEVGNIASFEEGYYFDFTDIFHDLIKNKPKGFIMQWQNEEVKFNVHKTAKDQLKVGYNMYCLGFRFENLEK